MRKNIPVALIIVMMGILTLATPAYGAIHGKKNLLSAAASSNGQNQNKNRVQNCELVQDKLNTRTKRMERKLERHIYVFNQIQSKLVEMAAELKADGYDVSKIEEDIATWKEKMAEFQTQGQEIIQNLQQTKYLACQDKTQFRSQLKQTRTKLKELMILTIKTRNFYRNTIKKDLIDIKNQKLSS